MRNNACTIEPGELASCEDAVIFDCRFSLADPGQGEGQYRQGHIPGAHYLHLERHMSSSVLEHGGRHPLPDVAQFVALLSSYGVGPETQIIAYDDHRLAYAARLWWMVKSLGFKAPVLLNGGFQGWLEMGGEPETAIPVARDQVRSTDNVNTASFSGYCDIQGLRLAQDAGCTLVDSREERRYLGLEEPIDPVAGHIPAAHNHPWQGVSDSAGRFLGADAQRAHWGDVLAAENLVVYCGSGVTACVNLFSLASLGRDDAMLYVGSWSDWCSYL